MNSSTRVAGAHLSMSSYAFCRPQDPRRATRFLFVGIDPGADLETAFLPYEAALVGPSSTSPYVAFAVLGSEEQAAAAREALATARGRELGIRTIKFAEAKETLTQADIPSAEPSACLDHLPLCTASAETGISGLELILDWISEEEETELLNHLGDPGISEASSGQTSTSDQMASGTWDRVARRHVRHFGFVFDYATRSFSASLGPFPPVLEAASQRISSLPQVGLPLDQITANSYPRGAGLAAHIDTHFAFSGPIVSLSLGSHCTMILRRPSGGDTAAEERLLLLPRRSLLIMSGESRYAWQHGITARKADPLPDGTMMERARRVSITFRKVRGFACDCKYPSTCDSQAAPLPITRLAEKRGWASGTSDADEKPVNDRALEDMEDRHVVQVYDAIAQHFSATRFAIWPKVREFMDGLQPGSIVADVGCGNGKYFGVRNDVAVIGSDRSSGLASVASKRLQAVGMPGSHFSPTAPRGADVFVADALNLPFRPGSCDAALCIAVLHHISSPERRMALLSELLALLRPGGMAIVTVWATEQEDIDKTIKKWTKIDNIRDHMTESQGHGSALPDTESPPKAAPSSSSSEDYFVPWNLPCHRAEAQGALTKNPGQVVDAKKGTIVFNRYYHLFTREELVGLVSALPGVRVVDVFYDKSNWCIVFERMPSDNYFDGEP